MFLEIKSNKENNRTVIAMMESLVKRITFFVLVAPMIAAFPPADAAIDRDLQETRYTGGTVRLADGSIRRRADVIAAFRKIHPCPSTMLYAGACPGWAINHDRPLACGGRDAVSNMSWMPTDIKTCAGAHCVDRYERKINALDPPVPDTGNCINQIVK